MRDAGSDRSLVHIDPPVEVCAVREDDPIRAQTSFDRRAGRQLNPLGRDDGALQVALHKYACAADVGLELRLLTDSENRVLDYDLPVDASLNGNVLGARQLARNGDGGSNGRHGA